MPALIDTHTFLWLIGDESRLSAAALAYVKDIDNQLFLSIASEWEIAIKVGKGRLQVGFLLPDLFTTVLGRFTLDPLPIQPAHLVTVATLPEHHRDPFDRLLVAQCLTEGLPIVSADAALDPYGVRRIW